MTPFQELNRQMAKYGLCHQLAHRQIGVSSVLFSVFLYMFVSEQNYSLQHWTGLLTHMFIGHVSEVSIIYDKDKSSYVMTISALVLIRQ